MYVSKAEGEAKDLMGAVDLVGLGGEGFLVGTVVVGCGDRVDDSLVERRMANWVLERCSLNRELFKNIHCSFGSRFTFVHEKTSSPFTPGNLKWLWWLNSGCNDVV